jgi:hypothetical protein
MEIILQKLLPSDWKGRTNYGIPINTGWLGRRVIRFTFASARDDKGWLPDSYKCILRILRTLDHDDVLVHYCQQGDTDNVQELFANSTRSPFDLDSHGFSLIKVTLSGLAISWESDAAYLKRASRQIVLLKFLLGFGVEPSRETIGLELAGPSPQSQYLQDHSRPLILGAVAIEIRDMLRPYIFCAVSRILQKDMWYYLFLVPAYLMLEDVHNPKQLSLPPVNSQYGDELALNSIPGSFGFTGYELQETTDGGKSKVWNETKSQDSTPLFEIVGQESKIIEQPPTRPPLLSQTAVSLFPKDGFTAYKQCKLSIGFF